MKSYHKEHSKWDGVRDPLTEKVIGCAIEVHKALGPGLLESAYALCLARELALKNISFLTQVSLKIEYKGVKLDCGYRLDFVVDGGLIIELKAVEHLSLIHQAQVLTYMKLSGVSTGLLINFNVKQLTRGVRRLFL